MYKVVEIDGVGPVLFRKNKRLKRLSMKVDGEGRVIVNIPWLVSSTIAKSWVEEKKDWIIKATRKIEKRNGETTIFRPGTVFKTFRHSIEFVRSDKKGVKIDTTVDTVKVSFCNDIPEEDILAASTQKKLKNLVEDVYKYEAKVFLIPRTEEIAREFGFKHGRISVRNNKSRWGSCSHDDNIILNIHLMRLPEYLRDYVILHELCHTVEKNHSKNFWDLMEKVCPNSKAKRKELGQYSTVIY